MRFRPWIAALLVAGTALAAAHASAESAWPSQPIRMIVPFTPGSTSDIAARAMAQKIQGPLGQPVIVENRPGANGAIGMQAVAKSRPDGYTLVVGSISSTAVPAVIMRSPPFDLFKEFTPVSVIAGTTLLLVAPKESPLDSIGALIAAAKKAPGTLNYANSAGLFQLAMESLKLQTGIDLAAISYKGPSEATNDLLGGRLTVQPDSLGSATRLIQGGRTKPLVILSGARTPLLPNVPTMQELGYKDFDFNGWIGVLAPAGTPNAIVERLHEAFANAIEAKDIRETYAAAAIDPVVMSPARYRELLVRETAKYQRIVEQAGIARQ
jgi:tripartite-type tricarboxylate transporter receptor subunit TctC